MNTLQDLVPVFDKIVSNTQDRLLDMERQIEEKEKKLLLLEQKCRDKEIASLVAVELPRDMQREFMQYLGIGVKYEFVIETYQSVFDPADSWMHRMYIRVEYNPVTCVEFSIIMSSNYLSNVIKAMKSLSRNDKGIDAKIGTTQIQIDDQGFFLRDDGVKLIAPRQQGVNFINSYKYLKHHQGTISENKLIYVYDNNNCTTFDIENDNTKVTEIIKIRL